MSPLLNPAYASVALKFWFIHFTLRGRVYHEVQDINVTLRRYHCPQFNKISTN
jgi:hypothetical protein